MIEIPLCLDKIKVNHYWKGQVLAQTLGSNEYQHLLLLGIKWGKQNPHKMTKFETANLKFDLSITVQKPNTSYRHDCTLTTEKYCLGYVTHIWTMTEFFKSASYFLVNSIRIFDIYRDEPMCYYYPVLAHSTQNLIRKWPKHIWQCFRFFNSVTFLIVTNFNKSEGLEWFNTIY